MCHTPPESRARPWESSVAPAGKSHVTVYAAYSSEYSTRDSTSLRARDATISSSCTDREGPRLSAPQRQGPRGLLPAATSCSLLSVGCRYGMLRAASFVYRRSPPAAWPRLPILPHILRWTILCLRTAKGVTFHISLNDMCLKSLPLPPRRSMLCFSI